MIGEIVFLAVLTGFSVLLLSLARVRGESERRAQQAMLSALTPGRGVSAVEVAQELADIATGKTSITEVTVAGDVISVRTASLYIVLVLDDGSVDGVIEAQAMTQPRMIMDLDDWQLAGNTPWELFLVYYGNLTEQLDAMIDTELDNREIKVP